MNYDVDLHQHVLINDLADGIQGFQALDQVVSVLIEWGFIDADFAAEYIKEMQEEKK